MSKRFEFSYDGYENTRYIYDCETELDYEEWDLKLIADILNEQDEKIKSLESQLANCIEPKFKIGQEVWIIFRHQVKNFNIHDIKYDSEVGMWRYGLDGYTHIILKWEDALFSTEAEAKVKLKEIMKSE